MRKYFIYTLFLLFLLSCGTTSNLKNVEPFPLEKTIWGYKAEFSGGAYGIEELEFYDDKSCGYTFEGTGRPRYTYQYVYKQDGLTFYLTPVDTNTSFKGFKGTIISTDVITLESEGNKPIPLYRVKN